MSESNENDVFLYSEGAGEEATPIAATIGEWNNYFSFHANIVTTKRSWVPRWLWNLVSESYLEKVDFSIEGGEEKK